MPSVGTAHVTIKINTKRFDADFAKLMTALDKRMEIAGRKAGNSFSREMTKNIDTSGLEKKLDAGVSKAVTKASGHIKRFGDNVENNSLRASDSLDLVTHTLGEVGDKAKDTSSSVRDLGSEFTQVRNEARRVSSSMRGIGRGGGGMRGAANDAGFFRNQLNSLSKQGVGVRRMLAGLHDTVAFVGTAMTGAVGALSSAAQGIFAVGANAAAAAPSLAIFANGLMSLAQVGASVGISMQGVGDALTAGLKPVPPAAAAAGNAAKGMGAATAGAARAIRDAKDALSDAYREAARSAADAARKVAEAEHALAQAQIEATAAQKALTAARIEGREEMEDIAFAAEDASLAERQAQLDLADAQQALAETAELAPDDRARVEAQLAYEEAELNMRQATDRREDADKAQKESSEKGVEGTEAVTSAQQDLADAQEAASQAAQDLADARQDEARTAVDNAERISEALQAVRDAQASAARAQQGGAAATSAAATAVDEFAAAMAKLSPSQQEFVRRIIGMQDEYQAFRKAVAEPLFSRLLIAMDGVNQKGKDGKSIMDILTDGLKGTSAALGDTAIKASNLASNDIFQAKLASTMEVNNQAIGNFGDAGVHLASAFVDLADAASPFFLQFSEWVKKVTKGWAETAKFNNTVRDAKDKVTPLSSAIGTAVDHFLEFWNLAKELWRTLKLVGGAASAAADGFGDVNRAGEDAQKNGYIDYLTDKLKEFNDALDNPGKKAEMIERFTVALENMNSAGAALKEAIIDPFLTLGSDKRIGEGFDKIAGSGDSFDRLAATAGEAAPALGDLVVNLADLLATVSESGSMKTFLETVSDVAGVLVKIVDKVPPGVLKAVGTALGTIAAVRFVGGIGRKALAAVTPPPGFFKLPGQVGTTLTKTKTAIAKNNPFTMGKKIGDDFERGLQAGFAEAGTTTPPRATSVMTKITTAVKEAGTVAKTAAQTTGIAVMAGLILGLEEGAKGAQTAASGAGKLVMTGLKNSMGVKSPSTISAAAGRDVMRGAALGIEEGLPAAETAAATAGRTVGTTVGTSMKTAAATSTKGMGATMGTAVSGEVSKAAADPKVAGSVGKFGKIFAGAGKVMGTAARGLGGAMNFMMGPWGLLIMILLPLLMPLLQKLNDKFHITQKVMDVLKIAVSALGDMFSWLWDTVLKPFFGWIADNAGKSWDKITAALGGVTDAFQWLWDKVMDVFGWFKSNWPYLLGIIMGPFGIAVVLIIKHWDTVLAFVKGIPDKIKAFLSGMWNVILDTLKTLWAKVKSLWDTYIHIGDVIEAKLRAGLAKIWDIVLEGLKTIWEKVKGLWTSYVEFGDWVEQKLRKGLKKIWTVVSEKLREAWAKVKEIWGRIVEWVKGRPDQFMKNLRLIWDILRSALSKAYDAVKGIWTRVTTWVKGRPGQFKKNLSALWDAFKDKLDDIWETVKTKWETIKTAVGKWPGQLKTKLAGLWDGLGDGLATAWNAVAKGLNEKVIGGINTVLNKFGVGDITVSIPTFPEPAKKAKGGPIRGPGGPTSDRVPIWASDGEYMLPARAARRIGPKNLEYMRKHGKLPKDSGGLGDFLHGVASGFASVGDALANGPETAAKWLIGKAIETLDLDDNFIADAAMGALKQSIDKIVAWVVSKAPKNEYPVPKGTLTYNWTGHNPSSALDMGVGVGTPVKAVMSGHVASIINKGSASYGLYLVMSHDDGWKTLYAHLSGTSVAKGAYVTAGTQIGRSGASGNISGPHLHLEVTKSPGSSYSSTHAELVKRKIIYPYAFRAAEGGVFSPSPGGTLTMIAEAGKSERVTPLDSEGFTPAERRILESLESQFTGGGDTYHVHPSERMNEAQLADMVARRVAWKRRRGGGFR